MNTTILLFLLQDGITNGAIYALLGLALVLVFAVTRVILIPQGEFITFGALTYATLSAGNVPGTAQLALAMGVVAFGFELFATRKSLRIGQGAARRWPSTSCCRSRSWPDHGAGRPRARGDRGQHRAVAGDRRRDRAVSVSHRLPAAGAHFGAGAADRLGRRAISRCRASAWCSSAPRACAGRRCRTPR